MPSRALWPAVALSAALVASRAYGSGFELVEQSPEAVATAGAQTADANAPAAVYYNPAALTFQEGTTVEGGANLLIYRGSATASAGSADSSALYATPTVFAGSRIAARYAVGIGVFDPFAWSISYPSGWAGRISGTGLDVRALAVNPSVAMRPLPWLAFGFGVDIVPTTLSYRRATVATAGGAEGSLALDVSGTGVGGNAGVLVRILPRWLDAAVSYRSAIDVDLSSPAARTTLALPHALAFALASHPLAGLTVDAEARLTLWQDTRAIAFTFSDTTIAKETLALDYNDTVGVRVGAAWRFLRDAAGEPRLTARIGAGWEQGPTNAAATSPLLPDGDRVLASAGFGARFRFVSIDAGYLAAIASDFLGLSGLFTARYRAVSHTVSLALTFRIADVPWRMNEPDYKR